MQLTRFLASAIVAFAGFSQAADSACTSSEGITIQNQGDTSQIQGCTTFTGNIAIATQTVGTITLNGIQTLDGDLVVDGATNVTSLSAPTLKSISGKFTLNNLQMLNAVSFPALTTVGDLTFAGLPNLSQLGFDKNVQQCNSLNIQNTFLGSLNGINLQQVNSVYIANNRMLQSLSFQVTAVAQSIIVLANGDSMQASFPNLETAQNITFRTCKSISIPSLKNVTGNLGFYENTFTTLEAVNLTSVSQTLAVNTNTNLNNISMPVLQSIGGGFQVQNNTQLTGVTFPDVQTIGGALDFFGGFNNVSLPALKDVHGGFNLQSSGTVDCSPFSSEAGSNKVIKGTFKCFNSVSNPGNATTTPTSGSGGTKKGAASYNVIPNGSVLIGVAGLIAGLMSLL